MAETNGSQTSQPLSVMEQIALGVYHALLAFALVHVIYTVWPSQSLLGAKSSNSTTQPTPTPLSPDKSQMSSPPVKPTTTPATATPTPTAKPSGNATPTPKPGTPTPTPTPTPSPSPTGSDPSSTVTKSDGNKDVSKETETEKNPPEVKLFGYFCFHPSLDMRFILLVLAIGALGSCIHAMTSLVDYVGNKTFVRSWTLWYVLRPFIGMALALVFYFVVRAGFITAQATNEPTAVNPFGIATLAALAGMFTKQATDKLNEVFKTFFRTAQGEGDDKRKDKLGNSTLAITALTPNKAKKGTSNVPLTLTGTNFQEKSVVKVNDQQRETKFDKPTNSLSINLEAADLANAGELKITVFNPASNTTSTPMTFTVEA